MKILRSSEWEPVAWVEQLPGVEGPAYLFVNKRYFDVVALKVVKWIDVTADVVYFYNAEKREVSYRGKQYSQKETELPALQLRAM